jgi:hypothetical protein
VLCAGTRHRQRMPVLDTIHMTPRYKGCYTGCSTREALPDFLSWMWEMWYIPDFRPFPSITMHLGSVLKSPCIKRHASLTDLTDNPSQLPKALFPLVFSPYADDAPMLTLPPMRRAEKLDRQRDKRYFTAATTTSRPVRPSRPLRRGYLDNR